MTRNRLALPAIATLLVLASTARMACAAAEIHRLNLVLSAIPTQISGGGANDQIDFTNRTLEAMGLESLDPIKQAWMFEAKLQYMINNKIAVHAGVGQIKTETSREFLPGIQQDITIRYEMFSVPVTVGAAYYFQPYNQGDFQARAYFGGGFLSLVGNRLKYQQTATGIPGQNSYVTAVTRDAPGFYVEGGVHMFFASRFSVLLGALYRSARVEDMLDRDTNEPAYNPETHQPFSIDFSGFGGRMGLGVGF